MALKLFGPGGIDQKSNDLVRDPRNLRDALNVKYSIIKEYEKRDGTSIDTDFSGDTYSDVIFINSLNEYFFRNGSSYYSYKNLNGVIQARKTISAETATDGLGNPADTATNITNISGAEYLNTFIFTHQDNKNGTLKYDGNMIYRAGLPAPVVAMAASGAARTTPIYILVFFDFIDNKGNQIYGPSVIKKLLSQQYKLTIDTLKNSGFYSGFIEVASGTQDIHSAQRTLTFTTKSSDIVAGSKVFFRYSEEAFFKCIVFDKISDVNYGGDTLASLIVETIVGSVITFTAASIGLREITLITTATTNVIANSLLHVYASTEETTGYVWNSIFCPNNNLSTVVGNAFVTPTTTGVNLLSNIYDITTSKLRPPKCKYISVFSNQLVFGNVTAFYNFENRENSYTNNDMVMYSDLSTGDSGEGLSEINRQLIGDTYDGQITGMIRCTDSLVVFKERSIYAIDGTISAGLYSLRKIQTNEIGCTSERSIMAIDSTVLFQGIDGIYSISGNVSKKYSGRIDPFFAQTGFDPSLTRSITDALNENYYFFTNKGAIVFNFEFKEWFIWDLANFALNGLTIDNSAERKIKMFAGSSVRKFISAKNDSNVAINAWIKTAWLDFGEPSLLKKIIDVRYFSLHNTGQVLTSRLYRDWDETKVKPDFTIGLTSSIKSVLRKLDIQQAQSVSLFIGNNVLDEDLNLSGIEINGGIIQEIDKNVK